MGWGDDSPGTDVERYNYDGGTPISSINGATKKGEDGFHDPYQKPPAGFNDWQEVGRHNMAVIELAGRQQDALTANGYTYHNGTWSAPGRPDVTGLGGQLPEGSLGVQGRWGDGPQGELTDGSEEEEGDAFDKYTIWGRILKLIDRWQQR